jgi:hypothetical protein
VRFLAEDIWKVIQELQADDGCRRIAVAYLSSNDRFRLKRGDVAIVDASDDAVGTGQTSAGILESAYKAGVGLFSNNRLHAKVIITSKEVLVGSANISQNSSKLNEAAIASTDTTLRKSVEAWWTRILEKSVEIDKQFIERIKRIPVERSGGSRRRKPTLAEALEEDLPVLKDYLYGWHTDSGVVSKRTVAAKARSKGLLPARIPSRSWGYFEWEHSPSLLKNVREDYYGKPSIDLAAVTDDEGEINRFKSIDPMTSNFIGAFRVKGQRYDVIIMVILKQNAPGLRLTGPHWRVELAKRLTRGLEGLPNLTKRLSSRATCVIELKELRNLFRAGAT